MARSVRLRLYLMLHLLQGLAVDVKPYLIVQGGTGRADPQKTICRLSPAGITLLVSLKGGRYHKSMLKMLILTSNLVSRTSHLDKVNQPGPHIRSSRTLRLELPTETFERKQGEL